MFLNSIDPEIAICSVGEGNKFGHPHNETLEMFKKLNVQYLITYEEGNIVFELE
jgi:competence protein ComEC